MSQLKNLDQVQFIGESEIISEESLEYIEEKAVGKMNATEVDVALAKLNRKKNDLEAKKKWWNGLSESEKQKQTNISRIWSVAIALLTPIIILVPALVMHSKYVNDPKKLSAPAWRDMDTEIDKIEIITNKGIQELEKRKKELSNSKHESTQLYYTENVIMK